jgi:hypothetical protein
MHDSVQNRYKLAVIECLYYEGADRAEGLGKFLLIFYMTRGMDL